MFSDSLCRRNVASLILEISALIAVLIAAGCGSSSSYSGGGGSPALAATVVAQGNFSMGELGAVYTIAVSNSGSGATTGTVTVADPPTGFTVTAISGANWSCALATTTCTYSSYVGAGQSFPAIVVTGNVTAANGAAVTIPVTLSGGGAASMTVTPTPAVNVAAVALAITKMHTGNFAQGQQGATYTVKVSNGTGAGTTSGGVSVTEVPDSGLTVTGMTGTNWMCTVSTLTCTRSDALTGGSTYDPITVTVSVSATATSPQNNKAVVSGGNQVTVGVQASDPTTINPPPVLQISKSHSGTFTQGCGPKPGTVHCPAYTVTVSTKPAPAGPTDGSLVTVTETPPAGMTVTGMSGMGWNCPTRTNTCDRSDVLAAGASYPAIAVTVIVLSDATSPQVNMVSVSGGGDSVGANTTESTMINAAPLLHIVKQHIGSFTQGETGATYTVTVSNMVGHPATSAPVTVTEIPPPAPGGGLTVTAMAGTNWACAVATLTCTRSDSLAAGASYDPITVTVDVSATATSPQVNNASVSGGGGSAPADALPDSTTILLSTVPTCPLPKLGNESLFTGTHIAILSGWKDGGGPSQTVAAFAANGAGLVTNGEMDSGEIVLGGPQSTPKFTTISSGCYQLGLTTAA